ncbi:MAG: HAD-IIB family hydrolase, partial [Nitrosomonadales bacterium]|nr:HAD-IIB family hydrolase [Nitrosomonadales bacterium]
LAKHSEVEKVDLLTRLIEDPNLSEDYAQPEEDLGDGARVVRLSCGPKRYLRKELLWPHLDQVVDKCLSFLRQQGRLPDLIHTHYADAGYVGQQLSLLLGIPQAHTGHSLGRPKLERMLASGRKPQALEKQFNFERRIAVEEEIIKNASLIVTSTQQEIDLQYGLYANFNHSRFRVIPPGTNTSRFSPPLRKKIESGAQKLVDKYLCDPEKPLIFSMSRPDARKNIKGLIEAYGNSPELQEASNLLIVAGTRTDIRELEDSEKKVMSELLFDIDRYDLWGKVAIPKYVSQDDVPEFYRLAARRRGVFVNPAFTEPFGLTLIEAAASGLPFVAPDDGGPRDIVGNCRNGLLANTLESEEIGKALLSMLQDRKRWRQFANNGLAGVWRHYSWAAHVEKYMKEVRRLLRRDKKRLRRQHAIILNGEKSYMPLVNKVLISDIDNTLLGDKNALKTLASWLEANRTKLAFGIATGRPIESAIAILKKHQVNIPDVLITSVGSEIHYGKKLVPDLGWAAHIRYMWRKDALAEALAKFPGLVLQAPENQREFKLSYIAKPDQMPPLHELYEYLHDLKLNAQLIYSHEEFLDVLPVRASKGHAIRYLAYKWGLPLSSFLVAGDSGNDIEMLIGDTRAIVVGNYSPELASLREQEQIYFAEGHYAAGIIEGLSHYGLD